MKRFLLLSIIFSFFFNSSAFSQSTIQKNIYFESDDYSLDAMNEQYLQTLHKETVDFTECSITIVGHTDQDGSQSYNLDLSKRRAEKVKEYLLNQGFSGSNIQTKFLGEAELVHQSIDDVSKRENRRVTIRVEGYTYDNVNDMVSQIEKEDNDIHTIEQNIESNIQLKKGTEVNIPSNAFCNIDGSSLISQKVDLNFKEAFEYTDMVDEGLFTQTSDQLLETGGMIYIEASQNGVPVRLVEGKSIELLFPEQEIKDGMELFTGVKTEDGVIWDETGEKIKSVGSNNNMPFIQVDLSPILDLEVNKDIFTELSFAPMPAFPHPARIAYPPYRENYTEEEYIKAVQKYEAVMKAHEEDKIDRPERVKAWVVEAARRRDLVIDHKKKYIRSKVVNTLKERLARLEADQDRISHEKLINVLFAFLERSVGKIDFNDWHYTKLAFGETVVDARKNIGLQIPDFKYARASYFFPEFLEARLEVDRNIAEKKYELGYIDANKLARIIDANISARYMLATSKLGWINCDRFYELAEEEKADLEFASLTDDDRFYLVFKNMRTLIIPRKSKGKVTFKGVPKGEDVRLVAVSMKDGNASMAIHDFTTDINKGVNLTFFPSEIKDLKKALEI